MSITKSTSPAAFRLVTIGFFLLILCIVLAQPAAAASMPQAGDQPITIYLFWGNGCPHCAVAKPFLEQLVAKDPALRLEAYEVWYDPQNQAILERMAKAYGFQPRYVPTILIGDQYWEGYNDDIQAQLLAAIAACKQQGCTPLASPAQQTAQTAPPQPANTSTPSSSISLPLLGKIELKNQPLFVSTILIGAIDGVNPCSMWVLTMLLALSLHTRSRRKVLIIGLLFLTVTSAIYGLFIVGVFSLLRVVQFIGWVQWLVALTALFFAAVNIKDYFFYKQGLSFTIPEGQKPGLFQKMRALMNASDNFWSMVAGTVVLSAGVSLVEFSCTAGFPVLWSNLLNAQHVSLGVFGGLLLVYLIIYQADEMILFGAAVATMRTSKMEEKHGRVLKLIGGMLMFSLALVMLINPNLMNDMLSSLWVFAAAIAGTLLVLFVHRLLLPWLSRIAEGSYQRKLSLLAKRRHKKP